MGRYTTRRFRVGPLDIEILRTGVPLSAHEARHIQGGADDLDAPIDARALALVNQGEIVFRAAAANTLVALAVGGAGDVLTSGGAGADIQWVAPGAPGAHEATHVQGGVDDIDSALDARAIALANQGEIVFHAAAGNTLVALAVGVAGQALLSGGPAADVSWGAPAPAAHEATHVDGGADEIDSVLDARALGLVNQGDITFRAAAANTLATLGPGAAGTALLSGGAGADLSWGAPAPAAHESTHVSGGADDIDSALDGRAITLTTQGDLVYASGVNTLARLPAGTAGQRIETGGAGANPNWTWDVMLDPTCSAGDHTGNGFITVDTVGENVDPGELCYMKADGKYWLADANAVATMPGKVIAMESIVADAAGRLLHEGYYRDDTWDWTLGNGEANLLFASAAVVGAIVQFANKPAGAGDQVQVLGYVVTADIIYFDPSYEMVEIA